ncbi:MAG: hypothetical protein J0L84_05305 [Verrucomicrobia bacterium]|nr:hypothetical protein [Verrucomicrobiota bacterium]
MDTADDVLIEAAIREAERRTSGEIRVFISRHPCADPGKSARQEFVRLHMTRTPLRNAVLLYFSPESRTFALAGDEGIQFRCGPGLDAAVAAVVSPELSRGRLGEAILAAVRHLGEELAREFPSHTLDRNDLPDSVIRD